MLQIFRALTDRLKAMFVANVGLDFESHFLARNAERKAELLRQADVYEKEGLTSVAEELRQLAESISIKQPLASVLPSLDHWQVHDKAPTPLLPATPKDRLLDRDRQPRRDALRGDRAASWRSRRDGAPVGLRVSLDRRRVARRPLRALCVRDNDRLPPLLHA